MMKKLVAAALLLMPCLAAARQTAVLSDGWRFHRGEAAPMADVSDWETVQVPHDWAIAGPFNLNEDMQFIRIEQNGEKQASLKTGRTGALPTTGIGWYSTTINVPADGQRTALEFDGVMSNARIYVNGREAGYRPYGYASFAVDVTDALQPGDNRIDVRVENLPEMSRFYTGAGIYRPVRMVRTQPVSVAFDGTFVTTPEVTAKRAIVNQLTEIANPDGVARDIRLSTRILDPQGAVVASAVKKVKLTGAPVSVDQRMTVARPQLWSPDTPNLYRSVTDIIAGGDTLDTYVTRFGIRTIGFDPARGFSLNGVLTKLRGVCLHHDLGPLGAAVSHRATERQLQMMKDMGANAVRTSHNPPSRELIAICDSIGLMVVDEAFDEWRKGKVTNGYNRYFDEWAERDLADFIRRDRNSPAVVMWSIGNEICEQGSKDGAKVAQMLVDVVHREDPTRPSTAGFNNHWGAIDNGLADAVDVVGFNYKHYDYERRHQEHPEYVLYGSETASTVSSRGVYKFPPRDWKDAWYSDYQVSSYDMDYVPWGSLPDSEFAQQDDHEYLLGEFVWTGFDYLGEPTPYGEGAPSRSSYFGIVDLAGLPKDRYYLYQSQWSDTPVLHLMPHWTWPGREGQVTPVQCYTNYPSAELFVNGISQGVQTVDPSQKLRRYRLMWDDVVYEPGEIKVVAYDADGRTAAEESVVTAGTPHAIALHADRTHIAAEGRDLAFITVDVTDNENRLCPDADPLLFVTVEGPGRLRALCNGDATDLLPFTSNYMRAFKGKLVAIVESTGEPGEITVRVNSERLVPAALALTAH